MPVDYHVSETLRNQTIGLDAVSLFAVAPLALLAAFLVTRGELAGRLLTLGVGAYTAYIMTALGLAFAALALFLYDRCSTAQRACGKPAAVLHRSPDAFRARSAEDHGRRSNV